MSLKNSLLVLSALTLSGTLRAQMTDVTQTPNPAKAGIQKSLLQEIGASRGDAMTPDSSIFNIQRDPFRAIRRGRQLFQRKFTEAQGAGPRAGHGVGDIVANPALGAGLADSCASCHGRPKGGAGAGGDVFTRPDSRDARHLYGIGLLEMLADEVTKDLRQQKDAGLALATVTGRRVPVKLQSKGISYGTLIATPNGSVDASGVIGVDQDLRVRPFFHQGGDFSIRSFVVGALKAEMGLEAPDPDLLKASGGMDVTTPAGMELTGSKDSIGAPPVASPVIDGDGDGVANEVDVAIVDYMEFYLLNYFKPGLYEQNAVTVQGRKVFDAIGCADCHVADLTIEHDRRVADVETVYDPVLAAGNFNSLFATATLKTLVVNDGTGLPDKKLPAGGSFVVKNVFTDLKRHDLGAGFHENNFDGTTTKQFMTEPLWGVGTTGPYGHDGRSATLSEVILRHGGEARLSRDRYQGLSATDEVAVLAFLQSLVLFPPDDTASNLNPGNPSDPAFPQKGHGSILLTILFNDPTDKE